MRAYIRPWLTIALGWLRSRQALVLENAALVLAARDARAPAAGHPGLGPNLLGLARAHLARLA